ncbi:MAG: hypothetical protein WC797_02525 [Candidatus Paceibacterota bacterium]|jgi:hypothetical protein
MTHRRNLRFRISVEDPNDNKKLIEYDSNRLPKGVKRRMRIDFRNRWADEVAEKRVTIGQEAFMLVSKSRFPGRSSKTLLLVERFLSLFGEKCGDGNINLGFVKINYNRRMYFDGKILATVVHVSAKNSDLFAAAYLKGTKKCYGFLLDYSSGEWEDRLVEFWDKLWAVLSSDENLIKYSLGPILGEVIFGR